MLQIFGNENAEKDDLLIECQVSPFIFPSEKLIIKGRWGTGKTAKVLLINKELSDILKNINPDIERLWYIDENTLNVGALLEIKNKSASDRHHFIKSLEEIWRAEIIRRACLLLHYLAGYYRAPNGPHWKFMRDLHSQHESFFKPIWEQLSNAFKIIFTDSRGDTLKDIHSNFQKLFTDEAMKQVQHCLKDIKNKLPKMVIAIEPIESPTSALEEEKWLAQEMVTSLLNAYRNNFQPDSRQLLEVRLCIPWHWFISDELDFPQKLKQYLEDITWTPQGLKGFINKRIEWEFKRVKRSFKPKGNKDAWNALFDSQVKNDHCSPPVIEDSFDYILRHTHHRPRDIQRLARKALEVCSQRDGVNIEDIIIGKGGRKVTAKMIRLAARIIGRDNADDLITEAGRRFPKIREIVDAMKGIRVPFEIDELKGRLQFDGTQLKDAIEMLWSAGIIGVQVEPKSEASINVINSFLPKRAYKMFRNMNYMIFHRWYLFEYNWDGDANSLINNMFLNSPDGIAKFVAHPKVFEYLLPSNVATDCPIGV